MVVALRHKACRAALYLARVISCELSTSVPTVESSPLSPSLSESAETAFVSPLRESVTSSLSVIDCNPQDKPTKPLTQRAEVRNVVT